MMLRYLTDRQLRSYALLVKDIDSTSRTIGEKLYRLEHMYDVLPQQQWCELTKKQCLIYEHKALRKGVHK